MSESTVARSAGKAFGQLHQHYVGQKAGPGEALQFPAGDAQQGPTQFTLAGSLTPVASGITPVIVASGST